MADRYTRKDAVECARYLAQSLKVKKFGNCLRKTKKGGFKWDIGCWNVDWNPIYGGAVIEEIMNDGGGVTQPFGPMRRKPAVFCETTNFARRALEYKQRKRRR